MLKTPGRLGGVEPTSNPFGYVETSRLHAPQLVVGYSICYLLETANPNRILNRPTKILSILDILKLPDFH